MKFVLSVAAMMAIVTPVLATPLPVSEPASIVLAGVGVLAALLPQLVA